MKHQVTLSNLANINIHSQVAFVAGESNSVMKLQKIGGDHWGFVNLSRPDGYLDKNNTSEWPLKNFDSPTGACGAVLTKFPKTEMFAFDSYSELVAWLK